MIFKEVVLLLVLCICVSVYGQQAASPACPKGAVWMNGNVCTDGCPEAKKQRNCAQYANTIAKHKACFCQGGLKRNPISQNPYCIAASRCANGVDYGGWTDEY